MHRREFRVRRIPSENLVIEKLPDGSTAVFDSRSGAVHSLNASAAAAFEACRQSRTVADVARAMSDALDGPVTGDFARAAIWELEAAGLVECSGQATSRKSVMRATV
jgi:PqqD family protein of HPr-rel-A system